MSKIVFSDNSLKIRRIIAVIPARGGSKNLPNKNIMKVNNRHPLIAYSIAIAKKCPSIERVIVTTDSLEIAKIAKQYKAEVPCIRPSELAQDNSTDLDWARHILNYLDATEMYQPDLIVHLRPTTPMREVMKIEEAISIMKQNYSEVSCLRSAHVVNESPHKLFKISESRFIPYLNGLTIEDTNKPRQCYEIAYQPNGYVDILKSSEIRKNSLHGTSVLPYITERVIEIDSKEDFVELERFIKTNPLYFSFS